MGRLWLGVVGFSIGLSAAARADEAPASSVASSAAGMVRPNAVWHSAPPLVWPVPLARAAGPQEEGPTREADRRFAYGGPALGAPRPAELARPQPIVRAQAADDGKLALPMPVAEAGEVPLPEQPVPATAVAPDQNDGSMPAPECGDGADYPKNNLLWVRGEYLLWWVKNGPVGNALVTTGAAADNVPGALGQPNTAVLFGNRNLDYGALSGGRFTVGMWANPEATLGVEVRGFFLGDGTTRATFTSDANGNPVLGNPFFSPLNGVEDVANAALPGIIFGSINVSSSSRLWGTEANAVFGLTRDSETTIHLVAGFRHVDLTETLAIESVHSPVAGSGVTIPFNGTLVGQPAAVDVKDGFNTRNQFYGGQIGAAAEVHLGSLLASATAKVALGATHQTVDVNGNTSLLNGPAGVTPTSVAGGLYAVSSNMGHHTRDEFSVVPEVELRIAYQLTSNFSGFVGYNFMYWSDVARPANQIDRNINVNLVPSFAEFGTPGGPQQPAFNVKSSDFWAQGLDFGLEFRY